MRSAAMCKPCSRSPTPRCWPPVASASTPSSAPAATWTMRCRAPCSGSAPPNWRPPIATRCPTTSASAHRWRPAARPGCTCAAEWLEFPAVSAHSTCQGAAQRWPRTSHGPPPPASRKARARLALPIDVETAMTRNALPRTCMLAVALALVAPAVHALTPAAEPPRQRAADAALQAAIDGSWRAGNSARDSFRNPGATLAFFGIAPQHTVIEITPGGGWYAEILAPYLKEQGRYVAAVVDPATVPADRGRDYQQRARDGLEAKFAAAPEQFGSATVVAFDPTAPVFGPAGSADLVVTFRNVHNWRGGESRAPG